MKPLDAVPFSGTFGISAVLALALVLVLATLWTVWRRERDEAMAWVSGGCVLGGLGVLAGGQGLPLLAALASRALVAWGLSLHLGLGRRASALSLLVVGGIWLPTGVPAWGPPALDGLACLWCLHMARRERSAEPLLLAGTMLCSASILGAAAVGAVPGGPGGGLGLSTVITGLMFPLVLMLRASVKAQALGRQLQGLAHFQEALSRTNQAIARTRDRHQLFEAICRICVESGHARVACVYVMDGVLARRASTAGPAAEILAGVPDPWDTSTPEAQSSYTVQAMAGGSPLVSNDYQQDPRARPWRALAVVHGVKAFAWLPFYRRGGVDGVLMLAADTEGFFTGPLMRLLEKLVGDISFALEALDQEAERLRAQQEAQASQASFLQLFNAAPVPSTILSLSERKVVAVNDAWCRALGIAREQLLGRPTNELPSRLTDADRESFYAELRAQGRVRNRLCVVHRADGSTYDELLNAEPIEFAGQPCLLLLSQDVSILKESERVRQALSSSEAASRAKTEFLARMSHELRTPLNAMLGFTQLLRQDAKDRLLPAECVQLDLVQQAGWHLLTLINDVLDVSRIESGHLSVEARPLAIAPLLDEALLMNSGMAAQQGVTLRARYAGMPALGVMADPTRLRQVVLNLLSNAIKYNRPGGSVSVSVQASGDRVQLLIADTGRGMSQEQMAHLYEPFNRLGREAEPVEGTGIGLVLTRHLLLLMHGSLDVASEPGQGTRVSVDLPRAEPGMIADGATPAPSPAPAQSAPAGTVLYVEDNEVNVMLVEQMLARWSEVRLLHAPDGRRGIEMAASLQPDLVLLDMQLPDMAGLDVLHRLRNDRATRSLRVVALSASAMPDTMDRARDLGVEAFWTKPLAFDHFMAEMSRLLSEALKPSVMAHPTD